MIAIWLARASVNRYGCAFRFLYGTVLGPDGHTFQIPLDPPWQRLPQILSRAELAALLLCAHDLRAHEPAGPPQGRICRSAQHRSCLMCC